MNLSDNQPISDPLKGRRCGFWENHKGESLTMGTFLLVTELQDRCYIEADDGRICSVILDRVKMLDVPPNNVTLICAWVADDIGDGPFWRTMCDHYFEQAGDLRTPLTPKFLQDFKHCCFCGRRVVVHEE